MNFPKKQTATAIESDRLQKQRDIEVDYAQRIADVNDMANTKVAELNNEISNNNEAKKMNLTGIFAGIGLVVGFFICVSKCDQGTFFDSVAIWLVITVVGAVIGAVLDGLAKGSAKTNTANCTVKIQNINADRDKKIADLNAARDSKIVRNTGIYSDIATEYRNKFMAAVNNHVMEMNSRTDSVYTERMDDLVAEIGNILASNIKNVFYEIDRDPAGDFVNQFISRTLKFHVFANGISLQAGSRSFTFLEKGLLGLDSDEETYARAKIIAERVVSYVQSLPSEKLDTSGREYAAGRQVTLTYIGDMYNNGDRFSWEVFDNTYDIAFASYVAVEITCRCVNSRYAPPV